MTNEAQAIADHAHYHHIGWIWGMFVVGILNHWLLQMWRIANDAKTSKRAIFVLNWIPMMYRSFWCAVIFAGIWQYPDMIAYGLKFVGHPVSADEAAVLSWPMNNVLAAAYGCGLDSLWGYVPFLKTQSPVLITTEIKKTKVVTETTEVKSSAIAPPPEIKS